MAHLIPTGDRIKIKKKSSDGTKLLGGGNTGKVVKYVPGTNHSEPTYYLNTGNDDHDKVPALREHLVHQKEHQQSHWKEK